VARQIAAPSIRPAPGIETFTGQWNLSRPASSRLPIFPRRGRFPASFHQGLHPQGLDRLTRALADFAKIVEILDAKGASFVSVTQQFNTTTSMGRLTD
jgi:site-specific DNA recombinase